MLKPCLQEFKRDLIDVVGENNLITNPSKILPYSTGIRIGSGKACAVILPRDLISFWKILNICIAFNKIIIIQAANTGLTGGSTPNGDNYDRDVVIINTLFLKEIVLLNNGLQVIAFPGATLYQLEKKLLQFDRAPHSLIGSSCIGASVVGGVCNNSGGNLVNRGPAYTELALYARINNQGKLELINHLGIDLGDSPEEILANLQAVNFSTTKLSNSSLMASDIEYKERVRDISATTPARFNADIRRLKEASGCAGKIAVFAVRLDTFPKARQEKVFFVGTNNPVNFTELRKKVLTEMRNLPDMGEYMNRNYFDGSDKYCKDTFLLLKFLGTGFLPIILSIKRYLDKILSKISFLPNHFVDKMLQFIAGLLPDHLPKRIRDYRKRYEHYMILVASDQAIPQIEILLEKETNLVEDYEYFECSTNESNDLLLHRYVAGSAPIRSHHLNSHDKGDLLPLDIALPRNCESWHQILTDDILSNMSEVFQMGHFLCMVFHWDFIVKKGVDSVALKDKILKLLNSYGAKYPAEHNVGHLYQAESQLAKFYQALDPTNTFNPGIGLLSKKKDYD